MSNKTSTKAVFVCESFETSCGWWLSCKIDLISIALVTFTYHHYVFAYVFDIEWTVSCKIRTYTLWMWFFFQNNWCIWKSPLLDDYGVWNIGTHLNVRVLSQTTTTTITPTIVKMLTKWAIVSKHCDNDEHDKWTERMNWQSKIAGTQLKSKSIEWKWWNVMIDCDRKYKCVSASHFHCSRPLHHSRIEKKEISCHLQYVCILMKLDFRIKRNWHATRRQ